MPRYILKPVLWNTNNYNKPSGVIVSSGYPRENGFGGEEWNHSGQMLFREQNNDFRAFHTEGIGRLDEKYPKANMCLAMYASHGRKQQLVAIAGKATCLHNDNDRREILVKKLGLNRRWKDAWELESVKSKFNNDEKMFRKFWKNEVHAIPNWVCPTNYFFIPQKSTFLQAHKITGSSKLLTMFNGFTDVTSAAIRNILNSVPLEARNEEWSNIASLLEMRNSEFYEDYEDLKLKPKTMREALVEARLGQGKFRAELEQRWNDRCAVTGLTERAVLRASHIKPWRACDDHERLDVNNGLLLCANLDALFDKGLITFLNCGKMLISENISSRDEAELSIPQPIKLQIHEKQFSYLEYHRNLIFQSN